MTTLLEPGRTAEIEFAEKSVLGAIITNRKAAEAVFDVLDRDDCFDDGTRRAVSAAVRYVTEQDQPHDPPTILARLVAAEVGVWHTGEAGVILGDLMRHASPSYLAHAHMVLRAAQQRRTIDATETIKDIASAPGFNVAESGDLAREVLEGALAGNAASSGNMTSVADLFDSAMDRLQSATPPSLIQFPYADLRELVPYLRPGQLITIGARPSHGKSLIGQDLGRFVGFHRRIPSVLFSLEMDKDEVMDRFLAAETGILLNHIVEKELSDNDWDRLAAARERFGESKLFVDDTPQATLTHFNSQLRGMARTEPAQLAIVDYVQLMDSPPGSRTENRQQEVSGFVAGLKGLARMWRIPVVMLCQLNRMAEGRADRRPYLSDARESGSVENESDVAILIHRPDFYEPESPRAGEADLLVDKNRNGRRGVATVGFQGHYGRFVDLARPWTPTAAIGSAA